MLLETLVALLKKKAPAPNSQGRFVVTFCTTRVPPPPLRRRFQQLIPLILVLVLPACYDFPLACQTFPSLHPLQHRLELSGCGDRLFVQSEV